MVIDSNTISSTTGGGSRPRVDARTDVENRGKNSGQPESAVQGDVSLSSKAKLLSKLENQLETVPEIDSERVANIRKALADGAYRINAESIAERMLDQDDLF